MNKSIARAMESDIEHELKLECYTQVSNQQTGCEMEAMLGVSVAALTIYDMCKAISQEMIIKETKLLVKTGGKSDINNG